MPRFRFPRGGVLILPALLIASGTWMAVALPAQAAGSWSAPVPLPSWAGFSENPSGAELVVTGTGPQVSSSPDGQTWSAPVTIGRDAAFAPLIGTDASGDAVIAWKGSTGTTSTGPVYTASLPADGSWTAPATLTTNSGPVQMAVNAAGSVLITWGAKARAAWADSGTILGGFTAPVMVLPSSYGHTLTNPHVALNNAGQAVLTSEANSALVVTRTASGTWSAPVSLACAFPFSPAIDGAGNAVVACEESVVNPTGPPVITYYTDRLPAGSATWDTRVLLTGDFLGGHFYSAADAAGTFVIAAFDATARSPITFTSPPGAGFGSGVPAGDSTSAITSLNLTVPGRATVVWTSSAGAFEATEPVS
jgi:hypothetical protein